MRVMLIDRLAALRNLASDGIVNGESNYVLVEVFNLQKEVQVCLLRCVR